ncbi:MAG: biotin/lipoyl-binding protein [Bacteroidetes bacterium]|nr:biotin/lipoyl-binding protein [Bacteroidota bacterium]
MRLIEKLLIANRGEIALRIIRSARKLGIHTVAVYAANEEDSWHVRMADEAFGLGLGELKDTYLNIPKILGIARLAQCDAIHPGYGFLSENPVFAQQCAEAGITFVGPHPDAILKMGNKVLSRELAVNTCIPVTAGLTGDPVSILQHCGSLPFPVLVKAAAGGGGKGMRVVNDPADLEEALEATSREAATYFGDGTVFVEQYIREPRHIEIQVLGDNHGNLIHLFERECSVQRRYQKIIEESPSPSLTPEVREKMGRAAVSIAATIGYNNAGTVEFLVDKDLNFFFLEMNTRIQVEHPVTEMVTGIDLVAEQLMIASGYPLRMTQESVRQQGHAIEARIYAEDPSHNFLPSPGEIDLYLEPGGKDIRVDSSLDRPSVIRSQYDPMISKLIVWGEDRNLARLKMIQALDHYFIQGIKTNIPYLKGILEHPRFQKNTLSTSFCAENTEEIISRIKEKKEQILPELPVIATLLFTLVPGNMADGDSIWKKIGYWRLVSDLKIQVDEKIIQAEILRSYGYHFHFLLSGREYETELIKSDGGRLDFNVNGNHFIAYASSSKQGIIQINLLGTVFSCRRSDFLVQNEVYLSDQGSGSDRVVSLMPGRVVKVNITAGQQVKKGDVLLVVEAMKMENNILSPRDGRVIVFNLKAGDRVEAQTELLKISENKELTQESQP